jgi:hypothetical protein
MQKETMTKKQKILTYILIVIGVAAMIFFGMRAIRSVMRMRGAGPFGKPPPADQTDVSLIRDWMTVPYVAKMYNVPPDALFKTMDISGWENRKKSLKELNAEFYPNQDGAVLAHIKAAIQAMQKQEPPPHFPATPITITPTP